MPTYQYVCNQCGHEFELFQSMTAPVKRKCPECGKLKLERLIGTGSGVLFKGSGFYQTDYRSESYRKAADADKKAATGPDKKSGDKASDSTTSGSKETSKSESKSAADKTSPSKSNPPE